MVHPKPGTEVLAVYEQDFYAGCPVITRNTWGRGAAYYLSALSDLDFLRDFYRKVGKEAGVENPLGIWLPYGVSVAERRTVEERRRAADGEKAAGDDSAVGRQPRRLVFVMNFRHEPVELSGLDGWRDAESGDACGETLRMEGLDCRILEREGL